MKNYFSAVNEDNDNADFKQVDIYEVTTGLSNDLTPKIPGELKLILNGKEYQNNQFDLAGENQEIIIVQRIKHNDPLDFALWKIAPNKVPEKLDTEGGDFTITPDGKGIAIAQGEGIAILPIESENQEKNN